MKIAIEHVTDKEIELLTSNGAEFLGSAGSDAGSECIFKVNRKLMPSIRATFNKRILTTEYWIRYLNKF